MITVQNLCKTYKVAKRKAGMREACRSLFRREYEEIHALDHISFQIEDGETIGYIGPNGAGKSTSIKVLSGILTPDEGTCVVTENSMEGSHFICKGYRCCVWTAKPALVGCCQ